MIEITQQWCIQIEVTNRCPKRCSNCTRCVQHVRQPFVMGFDTFRKAVDSVADFPLRSDQSRTPRPKCIGLMGQILLTVVLRGDQGKPTISRPRRVFRIQTDQCPAGGL